MPSIDNRIVQMEFDNKQFEKGIKQSSNSLKTLEKSLMIKDSSLSHLAVAVDDIAKRFTTLGIVGVTALQNITNSAINAGKRLISSLSFDQINAGFNKYEQTVASVQTIMNSTGKSIDQVNGYLAKLMWFSDETSYGFTDMTAALAQMTSSGGDIDKLIPLITGVANATAYAGKGAAEFSRAMYNLNQSYGMGSLQGIDWKSLELAGVGSKQLKQTIIDTGVALGKIKKDDVNIGNFQDTLQGAGKLKGWADRTVMETAFGVFSELSEAAYELVQSGKFKTAKEAMDSLAGQYSEIAEKAFISAQSAKTLTEAINATKDAVSSGWMRTYELVMGNLTEATALWSGVTSKLWDTFAAGAEARNELLQGWRDFEGREALIGVFVNIYNTLVLIAAAIRIAWQAVFPPTTAEGLANATKGLEAFTKGIVDWLTGMNGGSRRIEQISKIFEGFFGVLKIGWTIVKAVFNTIADVIGAILPGSVVDGFLSFFSDIGGSISDFANNLEKNEAFIGFFKSIGDFFKGIVSSDIFKKAVAIFNDFIAAIPAIATGIWEFAKSIYTYLTTSEDIKKWIGTISAFFAPFIAKIKSWGKKLKEALRSLFGGKAADKGKSFWDLLKEQFATPEGIETFFNNALALIKKTWTDFRQKVIDIFTGKDNKKLLAGGGGGSRPEEKVTFFDVLGNFFKDFGKWFSGNWGWVALVAGAVGVIKVLTSINNITKALGFLRHGYKASGLTGFVTNMLRMASSIAIVVGAITLLTLLDPAKLNRAMEIVGNITLILFMISALGAIPALSGGYKLGLGMMGIAASIVLVIIAIKQVMKVMEGLKTEEDVGRLIGAVVAVGVLVGALMLLTRLLNNVTFSGDWKVIVGIAVGVWIIVKALRPLADMSPDQLLKMGAGLLAFGVIMAGLLYIAESTPGGGTLKIGGMVGLALGIWLVIEALKPLTDMEWEDLGKMGAVLGGIVLAMGLYLKASKGMNAAGTVAAIGSLVVMAGVIYVLGTALREVRDVSWEQTTAFTAGMTTMLLGMASAFKLLGTMSLTGVGIALLAILGIIAIVALVVWAFGELSRDPDFQTFLSGAGASLGAMIGAFVGALDAAKMVAFAEGLNAFKNITVDEAAMDNAILVAGMLNEFSEALPEQPFIRRLSYIFAPTEVELLSRDISAFGRAITILSLGIDSIKKPADYLATTTIAIDAIAAVGKFLNSLFSEGITYNLQMFTWAESFFGGYKTETEKLKAHIEDFADAIKHLSWALNTIEDPEGFTEKTGIAIAVAIKIGSFLNILNSEGITNNLIHYTFFQKTFLGKRDQTAILVEHMKAFAQGIRDVSAAIGDITNPEGLEGNTAIAIAAATLISDFLKGITTDELTAGLGKYTIFEQIVLGKKDETKTLVDHMTTFGESVKTVSNSLKGVSTGTFIEDSASALAATRSILKFLVELTLAENDFSSGSTNFYKLTGAMGAFGRSLSAFEANTTGLDTVRMYSLSSSLSLLTTSISTLATMGSPEVIGLLTGTFETIAEILSADFSADIATGIQNGTTDITTAIDGLLTAGTEEIKTAVWYKNFSDSALNITNGIYAGIQTRGASIKLAIGSVLSAGITEITSSTWYTAFQEAAKNIVSGVASGVAKYAYLANDAMRILGESMEAALNESLKVESPSKLTFQTGVFLVDGLVTAVESEGDRAVKAATALGTAVAGAISKSSEIKVQSDILKQIAGMRTSVLSNNTKRDYWAEIQAEMQAEQQAEQQAAHAEAFLNHYNQATHVGPQTLTPGITLGDSPAEVWTDEESAAFWGLTEGIDELNKTLKGGSSSGGGGSWLTDWRSTPEQIVTNTKADLKRLAAESLLDEDKKAGSVAPKSTWDTIFEGLATVQEFLADPTKAFDPVVADLPTATKPTKGLSTKAVVGRVNWSETVGKTLSQMRDLSILGDKLDRLGDAVLHMKIVMNSGVVVGQIKTEMDRALGTAALYAGRG